MYLPKNLDNHLSLEKLSHLAVERDNHASDHEVTIKRDHLNVFDNDGTSPISVNIGSTPIGTDGGWKGFAEMLRSEDGTPIPVGVLKSLDRQTMTSLLDARITDTDKQVRVWNKGPDDRIIRGIVSPGFTRISAVEQVDQLLTKLHDAQIHSHKLVKCNMDDPDYWSAEIVDSERPLAANIDPQDSPSYAGFKMTANDIGGGACSVTSYLWRMICSNGMVSVMGNARMKAIHRGGGDWRGNLYTGADWMQLLIEAQSEQYADSSELMERLKALANRPSIKAVRQSLDEALKLSGHQPVSRWALSQGAAAAANNAESTEARSELHRWAGKLAELSTDKSLPTLESLLIAA